MTLREHIYRLTGGQVTVLVIVGLLATNWFRERANYWEPRFYPISTSVATLQMWRNNEYDCRVAAWACGIATVSLAFVWFGRSKQPPPNVPPRS